jgi:hypothetical protein
MNPANHLPSKLQSRECRDARACLAGYGAAQFDTGFTAD